jgi:glycosyltransferase involved in cell wall biosynthesis
MMKKLLFFTASYPYGLGEMWKSYELKYLSKYFDDITIVPYSYGNNFDNPRPIENNIKVELPLLQDTSVIINFKSLKLLIGRNFFYYLNEFFCKSVFLKKSRLISWLAVSIQIERLLRTDFIKKLKNSETENTVLYFYWGKGTCDIIPLLKKKKFSKIMVRMHRYDLFEFENNNYIPFRKQLLKSITTAAPSSEAGKEHLLSRYPKLKFQVEVFRCGTVSEGISKSSIDNILRIMTCSYIVPVKRLDILAKAILNLSIPVQWTHLGDGPLKNELESILINKSENITIKFEGMIPSNKVLNYYLNHPIDLFINVSSSEGVPFSIMEALSSGIPVFATNVGGTSEIIDDSVGKLLPKELIPEYLANQIVSFYNLSSEKKVLLRQNAFMRYQQLCNADILAKELSQFLIA